MNVPLRTPKTGDHLAWVDSCKSWRHFTPADIVNGYLARYPDAYAFTLSFEGGYVNDPDDPGGCTNRGITINTLKEWRGDPSVTCEDVYNLSEQETALIYACNYWAPVWGNRLPVGVNTQVWDFGVNAGPSRAIKVLQEIVQSPADGAMGPNTLSAVENYIRESGVEELLNKYSADRQAYYESLSTFDKYGNGWTRRNKDCLYLSLDLADGQIILPDLPTSGDLEERVSRLEAWAVSFNQ